MLLNVINLATTKKLLFMLLLAFKGRMLIFAGCIIILSKLNSRMKKEC